MSTLEKTQKIDDKIVSQDLNMLLSYERFRIIRKTIKTETLMLLRDEIGRLGERK